MSARGRFISLEGGEGVGKSTQVKALAAALRGRGLDVVETREPGGSEGAEKIRKLLLDPNEDWSAQTEALLFAAARADHVQKTIEPALAAGRWVLSDRFLDSSLAYQGGAGALGIEQVREIYRFGCGDFLPDRTLVLALDSGHARALERDQHDSDRIGGRSADYHRDVVSAFRQIADHEPERVRVIDASGAAEHVTQRLVDAIGDLLP